MKKILYICTTDDLRPIYQGKSYKKGDELKITELEEQSVSFGTIKRHFRKIAELPDIQKIIIKAEEPIKIVGLGKEIKSKKEKVEGKNKIPPLMGKNRKKKVRKSRRPYKTSMRISIEEKRNNKIKNDLKEDKNE